MITVVAEIRVGDVETLRVGLFRLEDEEPPAVARPRQWMKQNHVDPTENDGADCDPQRQGQNSRRGKRRVATQSAKTVAQVLNQSPHFVCNLEEYWHVDFHRLSI